MRHQITHVIEPDRLLMRWQSGAGTSPAQRSHWIVAELRRVNADDTVRFQFQYLSDSPDFREATEVGFGGYPAFTVSDSEYSLEEIDIFMKRLPPRSRADFGEYLNFHCLGADVGLSDFALLGYTGAKLPSDGFSFLHPFDDTNGPCEFRLEVAGWRHYPNSSRILGMDTPVVFQADPSNEHDPMAIRILGQNSQTVGYVPRGLTEAFHRWMRHSKITAVIHNTPIPEERPELALFVEVQPM